MFVLLGSVATWSIQGVQARKQKNQFKEDLKGLTDAYRQYYRDTGGMPTAASGLTIASEEGTFFQNYLPPHFRSTDGKVKTPLGGYWVLVNNLGNASEANHVGVGVDLDDDDLPEGWDVVDQALLSDVIQDLDGQSLASVTGGSTTGQFRYVGTKVIYLVLESTT
ncbi:MAG: hypothetical protein A2Y14_02255 [Verrucomicrobia bacterium GWF2_51_19]|nr:MAG: hypothetical protein A2Y14_02255 [Verrucomicrobia bacterium GWF2_51_19]HCJ12210.1 hypothetical protein [Opitutae bacterium]